MPPRRPLAALAVAALALPGIVLACFGFPEVQLPVADDHDASVSDAIADGTTDEAARAPDGAFPRLVALSVRGAASPDAAPPVLAPAFSPGVHDYYVRCADGSNALTVSMKASSGATSLLVSPTPSGAVPSQTLSVTVQENQAIVAVATDGVGSTEYWIRCLPHDFPRLEMDVHDEAGALAPGYYLIGNYTALAGESGYAMVLDARGVPVWYYRQPNGLGVFNVDDVIAGAISFIPGASVLPYEVHSLSPLVTTTLRESDEHELRVLANGHYLIVGSPMVGGVDLTGMKLREPDGGLASFGKSETVRTCDIAEVDESGAILWKWSALDHLDPVKDSVWPLFSSDVSPSGRAVVAPFHCNSIDVDPENGNLLVSAREMDSVFYIERPSGKILWKMGGFPYTKDGAIYVPVGEPFHEQHDARLQPGWSWTCSGGHGQVSLFDDETPLFAPARAVIYDVHVEPPGGATSGDCGARSDAGTSSATVAWQYQGSAPSFIMGSLRVSADGTRVIDWGLRFKDFVTFSEVSSAGADLVDFTLDPGVPNGSYRTIKVPLDTFDLGVLRATAGVPTTGAGGPGGQGVRGYGGDF